MEIVYYMNWCGHNGINYSSTWFFLCYRPIAYFVQYCIYVKSIDLEIYIFLKKNILEDCPRILWVLLYVDYTNNIYNMSYISFSLLYIIVKCRAFKAGLICI